MKNKQLLEQIQNLHFENPSDADALRIILNPLHEITETDYKLFQCWIDRSVNGVCPTFDFDLHGPKS
jgi:hypothetical protein